MYVVVRVGGHQERVVEGGVIEVNRLDAAPGEVVDLEPVLVADGGRVLASPEELRAVRVRARVLGEHRGPKVRGLTYKSKTRQRRRFGHRQRLTALEVTEVVVPDAASTPSGSS
jgi:large subunit ribosomal protein L21